MIWVATVLATFLFYKYVEKTHKVHVFKICFFILILAAVGSISIFGYNKVLSSVDKYDLKIEYVWHAFPKKNDRSKLASELFQDFKANSAHLQLHELSSEELNWIKFYLFDDLEVKSSFVPFSAKTSESETELQIEELLDEKKENTPARLKRLEELKRLGEVRIQENLQLIFSKRIANLSKAKAFLYGLNLRFIKKSFEVNGLEDEFLSKLSESERNSVSEVEMIFENLNSQLRDKMNKENLESSIEFRICNNEKSPLLRYTFSVSGKYKGRSSSYSLEKYGRLDSTSFSSDIIIDSKSCQNVIWTDRYQYFDSYEIKNVNGYWK